MYREILVSQSSISDVFFPATSIGNEIQGIYASPRRRTEHVNGDRQGNPRRTVPGEQTRLSLTREATVPDTNGTYLSGSAGNSVPVFGSSDVWQVNTGFPNIRTPVPERCK